MRQIMGSAAAARHGIGRQIVDPENAIFGASEEAGPVRGPLGALGEEKRGINNDGRQTTR